jgi:DNA-binding response OmpR family regulator
VERNDPQLAIMMPGMDRYSVLQKLREDVSTAFIPVILLSALDERWNVRKGMETEADDYLGKPVLRQELLAAIRTQLNKHKRKPGGSGGHIQPASPSEPPSQPVQPQSESSARGGKGEGPGHGRRGPFVWSG